MGKVIGIAVGGRHHQIRHARTLAPGQPRGPFGQNAARDAAAHAPHAQHAGELPGGHGDFAAGILGIIDHGLSDKAIALRHHVAIVAGAAFVICPKFTV